MHGKNVVVGNLVYSLVLGMSVPDVSGAAIANLEVESLHAQEADVPRRHDLRRDAGARRASSRRRKPDRGIVTVETKGLNQRGEEVCYFRRKVMVWKRDAAPGRRRPVRRHGDLGMSVNPTAASGFGAGADGLRAGPSLLSRRRRSRIWSRCCGSARASACSTSPQAPAR